MTVKRRLHDTIHVAFQLRQQLAGDGVPGPRRMVLAGLRSLSDGDVM
jgi:hypothetical protein